MNNKNDKNNTSSSHIFTALSSMYSTNLGSGAAKNTNDIFSDSTHPTTTNPTTTNSTTTNSTTTNPTIMNPTITNPTTTNPKTTNPTIPTSDTIPLTVLNGVGILRQVINNKQQKKVENFLTMGNPKIDFFKKVYYRYYNFSTQSFSIPCKGRNYLEYNEETKLICTLGNKADLLGKIYLNITLPKVVTNNENKLSYIRNLGLGIIKNIELKIKGQTISRLDGKKIYILNKMLNQSSNVRLGNNNIDISIEKMKYSSTSTDKLYNTPIDIQTETLIVPLPLGFSKHTTQYLPLFLFKTDDIRVHITLRALNEIYTVQTFDKNYWYYAKEQNISGYSLPNTVKQFRKDAIKNTDMSNVSDYPTFKFGEQTKYKNVGDHHTRSPFYLKRYESRKTTLPNTSITGQNIKHNLYECCSSSFPTSTTFNYNIQCSLEVDQIFLDTELKQKFNEMFIYSYLFEHCIEDKTFVHKTFSGKNKLIINFINPIKNILLGIERSDNDIRNEWLNFTNYEDSTLTEEKILKYQDNWWFSAISGTKLTTSETVTTLGGTSTLTIVPDNFQEFLFRYGPYGEAGDYSDISGVIKNNMPIVGPGFSNWPNAIQPHERLYTIKEINEFRSIWRYRAASDIPNINVTNLQSTWKESPLDTMEIVFHNNIREEVKPSIYYNMLQPYKYSNNMLDPGLFLYSFSIDNDNIQPHGSYQLKSVLHFILHVDLNESQTFNNNTNSFSITPYALCYNIIEMKQDTFSLLYYNY